MLDSYNRSEYSFMFLRNNRKANDLYVDGCCYEGDLTISLMFVLRYSNCMRMFYIALFSHLVYIRIFM